MNTFCAICQTDTQHSATVTGADITLICVCGHPIKFPASFTKEQVNSFLAENKSENIRPAPVADTPVDQNAILNNLGLG